MEIKNNQKVIEKEADLNYFVKPPGWKIFIVVLVFVGK